MCVDQVVVGGKGEAGRSFGHRYRVTRASQTHVIALDYHCYSESLVEVALFQRIAYSSESSPRPTPDRREEVKKL